MSDEQKKYTKLPTLADYEMEYNENFVNVWGNKYAQLWITSRQTLGCRQRMGYKEGYKPYAHYKPTIDEEKQYLEPIGYADTEKYVLFVYKVMDYYVPEEPVEGSDV